MAGLGGIIAGALGGAGAAYAESAQGELKNQQRMDLERELADVAFERDQRVKEADVMRSRSNTKYNQSEAVLKEASDADMRRTRLGLENSTALAAETSALDMLKARLAAKNETDIAPDVAGAAMAKYTAGAPLAKLQRESATQAEIDKATTLGSSPEYLAGTAAVSKAQKAAEIEAAKIRAEKAGGGGAGGGMPKVRSTYTNADGDKIAVMSDGSEKTLGKAGDFNKQIASTIATMAKNDYRFSKLPESEKRAAALERLTGVKVDGGSLAEGPTGGSKLPPLGDSRYVIK